jgi:hemoglobin
MSGTEQDADNAGSGVSTGSGVGSGTDSGSATPAAAKATTPFERLGREPGVRALVDRFYDLMDLEPGFAGIRRLHPSTLDGSRDKLYWYLCGWLGGPDLYISQFGHPRLRARHLPYAIGNSERDQWMACMVQALADTGVESTLAEKLTESFFGTADWMRNQ